MREFLKEPEGISCITLFLIFIFTCAIVLYLDNKAEAFCKQLGYEYYSDQCVNNQGIIYSLKWLRENHR